MSYDVTWNRHMMLKHDFVTAHMWSRCFCRVCDSRQSRFLNILWHRPHIMSSRGACTVRKCRSSPPRWPEDEQKKYIFNVHYAAFPAPTIQQDVDPDSTLKKICSIHICANKPPRYPKVVWKSNFFHSLMQYCGSGALKKTVSNAERTLYDVVKASRKCIPSCIDIKIHIWIYTFMRMWIYTHILIL